MTGALDPKCKARLIGLTSHALSQVTVTNGMFVHTPSTTDLYSAQQALPSTGKVRQKLDGYVGENPFFDFAYEVLSRELKEKADFRSGIEPIPLTSIEGFGDTEAIANRMVDDFESLPWTYSLTVVLPDSIGKHFISTLGEMEFSPGLRLVALSDEYKERYPLSSDNKERNAQLGNRSHSLLGDLMMDAFRGNQWPEAEAGLQFTITGFVGIYGISDPAQEALNMLDSFFGLCVALNLLKVSRKYHRTSPQVSIYMHRLVGESWQPERKHDLESLQSQAILELELSGVVAQATQIQLNGYFHTVAGKIRSILAQPGSAARIVTASKWLLNSYVTSDVPLSFVQATIVLEILLGEETPSEKIGLTELLRNRCAYLVASNYGEREAIKKQFSDIYNVRSKIVHTGKNRLSSKESFLLAQLKALACRVIAKEVSLLMAGKAA